jgi:hypothetical protein
VISIAGLKILSATQVDQGKPVSITPMGRTISGQRMSFMTGSGIWDQFRLVVRDRDLWVEVWKRIHSIDPDNLNSNGGQLPSLPEIDFSREIVIVAAMGRRPSSGYGIFIDSAYERNDRLEVVVRSVENRRCGGFTMMTAPVDIVRLPKTDRPVLFRETEVVLDCR